MKTTIMLFAVIFLMIASPVPGDIEIFVRADLLKIKTVSKNNIYSQEVIFEDGKAIWPEYGDFYFAFYNEEALKFLVEFDSTKVVLVLVEGEITPSFGNLYIVIKNLLWGVGTSYGLDPEIYYVWPVKFTVSGIGLKNENGILRHKGIAPFGDNAIDAIPEEKLNNPEITENFSVSTESENKK